MKPAAFGDGTDLGDGELRAAGGDDDFGRAGGEPCAVRRGFEPEAAKRAGKGDDRPYEKTRSDDADPSERTAR